MTNKALYKRMLPLLKKNKMIKIKKELVNKKYHQEVIPIWRSLLMIEAMENRKIMFYTYFSFFKSIIFILIIFK
jgi:hypothetical protein